MQYALLADRLNQTARQEARLAAIDSALDTLLEVVGIGALTLIGNVVAWGWLLKHLLA